ncbi:conserved hypothetical protein [Methylobacterium sp. 4-46]|uniref:hypothetical protein n=1 Tax=unclassified Methylobacterium TaxID=2615210 RepID=UPI000152C8ED|nr:MULTISPECIES: hypothetical protein [Methylobacterium]ACA17112.1 conserved hypothetical protein [Methylobacterium sp. 4-46]WFT82797.1 hypothetical protein QA634_13550 [Methylobacterium nodulans]
MLVFGDRAREGDPGAWIARIEAALRAQSGAPPGLARHAILVGSLIEAGELAQGIADADLAARGEDAPSGAQDLATALLMALARAAWHSWRAGCAGAPVAPGPLAALAGAALPARISGRRAEGFAFYALYPEGYGAAAAGSGLTPGTTCLGIRSIGLPLAAMVAAALGARAPLSVRPVGHPFDRRLALGPGAERALAEAARGEVAIVDEGPGLSGSSFGAASDALAARGAGPERLAFFPSHPGEPGPRAAPRHRRAWARARRHLVPFERLLLDAENPAHRLAGWVSGLLGPLDGPLEEVSGGAWRRHHFAREADWPPVNAQLERRKFLARAGGATWLVKFVGLGPTGEAALARARRLHAAGFTPPVAGLVHGFLVERWLAEARPLRPGALAPLPLAEAVGRYLAFRAAAFPADPEEGATLPDLVAMARHNAAAALGEEAARGFSPYGAARLAALGERRRPVRVDARLQPWEWLVLPDGSLRKADALDHHAGHDLVGCQDIAWDVAGARVELDLPSAAAERIGAVLAAAGIRPPDPDLLGLHTLCYLAFRLGACTLAAESGAAPDEALRLRAAAAACATRLDRLLRESR